MHHLPLSPGLTVTHRWLAVRTRLWDNANTYKSGLHSEPQRAHVHARATRTASGTYEPACADICDCRARTVGKFDTD